MTDLIRQLRDYGDQIETTMVAPHVDEVRTERVGAGPVRPILERPHRSPVPRWVVVVAVAAVVAAGAALVISAEREGDDPVVDQSTETTLDSSPTSSIPGLHESSRPLEPSGLEFVAGPRTDFFTGIVSDESGAIWGWGAPGLARFDPATGETRTWTVSEDPWFSPRFITGIVPARDGGVWMYGAVLARFDGTGFTRVIEPPNDVIGFAEAHDGGLWAATLGDGVLRWDGSAWTPTAVVAVHGNSSIVADASDGVWVTNGRLDQRGSLDVPLLHFDGSDWIGYQSVELDVGPWAVRSLTPSPEGGVWMSVGPQGDGQGRRLLHVDDAGWSSHMLPELGREAADTPVAVAVGSDETVWASFGPISDVFRFDGETWTSYETDSDWLESRWVTGVAVTADGAFLGGFSGLIELVDDRWVRVVPESESPSFMEGPYTLAGVSHDELWMASGDAVWHYRSGNWDVSSPIPGIRGLALGADDTVWAAGEGGTAYFDGDRWSVVDDRPAGVVTSDRTGGVWVSGPWGPMEPTEPWVTGYTLLDGAWVATPIEPPPAVWINGSMVPLLIDSMAVGADGSLWVGSHGGGLTLAGGMARHHDGVWQVIDQIGTSAIDMVGDIAVAPDGDVWTIVTTTDGGGPWVVQYDGVEWTIHEAADLGSGHYAFDANHQVWIAPDGRVFVPRGDSFDEWRTLMFDGRQWTGLSADVREGFRVFSIAPDGTIWMGDAWGALLRVSPE